MQGGLVQKVKKLKIQQQQQKKVVLNKTRKHGVTMDSRAYQQWQG